MGEDLVDRLVRIVGSARTVVDPADLAPLVVDWTGRYRGSTPVAVRPDSTDEVARIVRLCRETRTAIVPQGGNTGLVGGSVPLSGELLLSTRGLSAIGEVDSSSRQIIVGAGVILADVQQAALAAGLRYPVDFGARGSATVGGTIATNAGGIAVLRYGMTRRHVVGIEAVLGSGEVISHLGGLVKDNTGYDLAGLLCGSEGTLGVVTAARLQLVPVHAMRTTILVGFTDVSSAMVCVDRLCATREDLDALELVLESGIRLVCDAFDRRAPFEASAFLIVEASSDVDRAESLADFLHGCTGTVDIAVAASAAMRERIWQLREEHTPAINTLGPPIKFDVTVPTSSLADFADSVQRVIADVAPRSRTFLFGHAADGNLHVNVCGIDSQASLVAAVEEAVMSEVAGFGGSVSAEHGIGTAKKRFLTLSRAPAEIAVMRAVKRAMDPDGIMNPNVLFD